MRSTRLAAVAGTLVVLGAVGCCGTRGGQEAATSPPELVAITRCVGYDAEQMGLAVTATVELLGMAVPSVAQIRSVTVEDASVVTVVLQPEADRFAARAAFLEQLAGDGSWLPDGCDPPLLGSGSATAREVMSVALVGDWDAVERGAEDLELAWLAVQGVEQVRIRGLPRSRVRVALDPDRAAALGVAPADVLRTLETLRAGQAPGYAGLGVGTLEELGTIAVAARDGRVVLLGDLATVETERPFDCGRIVLDDAPAATMTVLRTPETSAAELDEALAAALDMWRATAPPSIQVALLPGDPAFVVQVRGIETLFFDHVEPIARAAADAGAQDVLVASAVPRSDALQCDDSSRETWISAHGSGLPPEETRLLLDDALQRMPGVAGQVTGLGDSVLEVEVSAIDAGERRDLTRTVTDRLSTVPGLLDVRWERPPDRTELRVDPDRAKLAALGLRETDVVDAVRLATEGVRVGEVSLDGLRVPVVLGLGADAGAGDPLRALRTAPLLVGPDGAVFSLGTVAQIEIASVEAVQRRSDLQPVTSVFVRVEPGDERSATKSVVAALGELELPVGAWVRVVQ